LYSVPTGHNGHLHPCICAASSPAPAEQYITPVSSLASYVKHAEAHRHRELFSSVTGTFARIITRRQALISAKASQFSEALLETLAL
jgi:hypothetical protein